MTDKRPLDDQQNLADERRLADTSVREEESAEIWATLDRENSVGILSGFWRWTNSGSICTMRWFAGKPANFGERTLKLLP